MNTERPIVFFGSGKLVGGRPVMPGVRLQKSTMDSLDNEAWIIDTGDAVIQKKARVGMKALTPWETLVYCVWVADYGMRNAGDLDTAQDVYSGFHSDATRTAAELSLPLTLAAFTLQRGELESQYFDRFDAMIEEIKHSGAASFVDGS